MVSIRSKRRIREALGALGAGAGPACVAIDEDQLFGHGAEKPGAARELTSFIVVL